ncbi:Xaa-Pro dipeptidase [Halomonas campisalis]|uniref:Xaa-Pro dipeptidase n=1 Tax=Billgrantia campisalis TaxID=74661 RepID=A0ABS9P7A1_9GAMM|nr:Xaa-Pro dipeptidase [Halomonas campisalis]MCG6657112.1 Xaa-Pro dipeptidase [Halomonas campisalis]MDR5862297.1 Xaa-Pro dipeptidase [Halomonas campisalis]
MTHSLADAQRLHLERLEREYACLLDALGYDGVLLYSGHPHRHFADDQEASFATYGHFLHWVPLAGVTRSWLLLRAGQRPALYFHAPRDFWHLPPALPDEAWTQRFAIELRQSETPPPLPAGRFAVLGEVAPATAAALGAELNPERLTAALDELRVCKSDYEVACLREANRRAMQGHLAACDAFRGGAAELDVQLAYLKASRQRESDVPYGNIVGINAHGGVLHYQHYDLKPPDRQHSLLVDAGHRVRGYCADITRTWSGADADSCFPALIDGVTALQRRLIAALRPGVSYVALHERMHDELGALLADQGVIRCSPEAAVAAGITRAFCPHGLGHLLGLQVHDVAGRCRGDGSPLPPPPEHPALRLTRELEAGMVVTVEPGLYVIPMLLDPLRDAPVGRDIDWTQVERLAPHGGIRIEDNVLITAQGADNLTPGDAG